MSIVSDWSKTWKLYVHDYSEVSSDDYEGKQFTFFNHPYSEYIRIIAELYNASSDTDASINIIIGGVTQVSYTIGYGSTDYILFVFAPLKHYIDEWSSSIIQLELVPSNASLKNRLFEVWVK